MTLHLTPVGRSNVWRSNYYPTANGGTPLWVVEYWVGKTICEQFFHTWAEAYQFAFARATA